MLGVASGNGRESCHHTAEIASKAAAIKPINIAHKATPRQVWLLASHAMRGLFWPWFVP